MDRELGGVEAVSREANAVLRGGVKGGPPVEPVAGSDSALVGTSVEFVLAAVGGAVREPLIGGAPTPELAYQRTHAGELAVAELQRLVAGGLRPTGPTLELLADCALVCGRLEQHYRVGPFRARELALADPAIGEPEGLAGIIRATDASAETRADLVTLLKAGIRDTADLYAAGTLHIDPVFALSSALGGADADVIADGVLIDFKASRARSVIGAPDVYQLVGYALADLYDWYGIGSVGIHALRWRTRWTMSLEDLLFRLSGVERPVPEWRERFSETLPTDDAQLSMLRRRGPPSRGRRGGGREMRLFPRRDDGAILADVDGELAVLRTPSRGADPDAEPARGRSARAVGRHVRSPATRHHKEQVTSVIDQIRRDIQERFDQLLAEADKLRRALGALGPHTSSSPARDVPASERAPVAAPGSTATPKVLASKRALSRRAVSPSVGSRSRTAPGATKTSVLAALAGGEAMTAGEVASKTGLPRATVSTTLSKLAKTGEVEKAERGYRLPAASTSGSSSDG
jgi:DNA-binding transcriptional ArsR family regulator